MNKKKTQTVYMTASGFFLVNSFLDKVKKVVYIRRSNEGLDKDSKPYQNAVSKLGPEVEMFIWTQDDMGRPPAGRT